MTKNNEIVRWYIEKALLDNPTHSMKSGTDVKVLVEDVMNHPKSHVKYILHALELAVKDVG